MTRTTMNGKPVYEVPAKAVINFESGFKDKLLCDGPTFSAGSACVYSCSFCYVPAIMAKNPHLQEIEEDHMDVVIRRSAAVEAVRKQLTDRHGKPKFTDPNDNRVIYSSPLVDVAGNMELVRETIEICATILELTNWQIRLLSKSNLLPKVAQALGDDAKNRVIYGVSSGTLDNKIAQAIEGGTPLVSKRLESLHWLQDNDYRTFGMICPSLPSRDYRKFAEECRDAGQFLRCEHVWAEVINLRGESMTKTVDALRVAGYEWEAIELQRVSENKEAWEEYARATFEAHAVLYPHGKLRFLQYINAKNEGYWQLKPVLGAVLLGRRAKNHAPAPEPPKKGQA